MTEVNKESGLYNSSEESKVCLLRLKPTIHEPFHHDVTAEVKAVSGKRKATGTVQVNTDITIREIDTLKKRLDETIADTNMRKTSARAVTIEMAKQLERAHQRELKEHTRNLALQLENLKLRALLEAKASLVNKLIKELSSVRRVVKHVAKGLESQTSGFRSPNVQYGAFKKSLEDGLLTSVFGSDGAVGSTNSESQ